MTAFELSFYNSTPNPMRFSLASCKSEDTVDSAAVATPMDASPLPPPSNVFSVINIVNDDPLPDVRGYQAVAASYAATTRQQVQTPRRMTSPVTPTVTTPPPVAQFILATAAASAERDRSGYFANPTLAEHSAGTSSSPGYNNSFTASRKRKFWPKLKHLMIPSTAIVPDQQKNTPAKDRKLKHLFKTMSLKTATNKDDVSATVDFDRLDHSRHWPRQKRSQVGPRR